MVFLKKAEFKIYLRRTVKCIESDEFYGGSRTGFYPNI